MTMITAGIDCGSQNTKVVVLKDGKIIGKAKIPTEFDVNKAAEIGYELALKDAGIEMDEISATATTGAGRNNTNFGNGSINEIGSAINGARFVKPDTFMIIDMGAESCRAIRLKDDGTIKNYEVNDKCASGAGTFIEAMARALEIEIDEIGPYSLKHTKELNMNAQCVVFAESEVISLIHHQELIEDIAYGIHSGIATRAVSLARRLGIVDGVTMIGGPGHNVGLVDCLKKELGKDVFVSEYTDYMSAIGAAIYAAELV